MRVNPRTVLRALARAGIFIILNVFSDSKREVEFSEEEELDYDLEEEDDLI